MISTWNIIHFSLNSSSCFHIVRLNPNTLSYEKKNFFFSQIRNNLRMKTINIKWKRKKKRYITNKQQKKTKKCMLMFYKNSNHVSMRNVHTNVNMLSYDSNKVQKIIYVCTEVLWVLFVNKTKEEKRKTGVDKRLKKRKEMKCSILVFFVWINVLCTKSIVVFFVCCIFNLRRRSRVFSYADNDVNINTF